MEDLIHTIYVSAPPPTFSEHDTFQFLAKARKVNRQNDVSGMLLYTHRRLLLLLEGEPTAVDRACSAIFSDERQYRMLLRESITEREFPEWTLGFETVDSAEAGRLLGKPLRSEAADPAGGIDAESAKTLLSIMGRRRWQSDRSGMFRAIRRMAKSSAAS
jgi:FAD-dependent sensor of blue light